MEQPLFPSHTVTLRPSSAHFFFSISHLVLCRSCLPFFFKPSSASHTNPSQWPSPRTTQPITRVSYPFAFSRARPPSSSSRLLLLLNLPSDDSCLSIPFPFSSPCFVLLFFFFFLLFFFLVHLHQLRPQGSQERPSQEEAASCQVAAWRKFPPPAPITQSCAARNARMRCRCQFS